MPLASVRSRIELSRIQKDMIRLALLAEVPGQKQRNLNRSLRGFYFVVALGFKSSKVEKPKLENDMMQ